MNKILRSTLKIIFGLAFRIEVRGLDNVVSSGKLLVIANHESFLDGIILGLFLPLDPVFIVNTGIAKNRLFKWILGLSDYVTVDPTNPMAVKKIIKLIDQQRPVVIFPEGRITDTGSMMKVYDGPAFVAAKTGATILPIRIDGSVRSYFGRVSGSHAKKLLPKITVTILKPEIILMPDGGTARQRRRSAGDQMRKLMQRMIFESYPKQTLYESLLNAVNAYGAKQLIAEDAKQIEYSYRDILKMTLVLGRMVANHSQQGEHAGILLPNLASTVAMLIGTTSQGRVPAMLNYKAGVAGMQDACTAAQISTIFSSRIFVERAGLEKDIAALQNITVLYIEDLRSSMGLRDKAWVMRSMLLPRLAQQAVKPSDTAVILFTSGSEGKPKGVALSHNALLSNIAQIRSVIDFSSEDKVLNALPIFHSFGLTGGALLPILTGMKLFLYPTPLHYRVIPEIAYDRNCTVLFGTSTFLGNYAKHAHPYDFFRLRHVVAGAEKLSDAVRDTWIEKFGIRILEGYGATETAPVLAVNTPMAYCKGTVGQLLPAIEYQLVPVPGIDIGGMLHVRGPNLMSGYYRYDTPGRLQPPSSSVGEGWYETGDIVSIDEEGFISIAGRMKRFAKISGEMVSLEVVESIAAHASLGAQHAATSQPDSAKGEVIVLFTTNKDLTRADLIASAKDLGLPEITIPRKVHYISELPLLGTGKTDYVALKSIEMNV